MRGSGSMMTPPVRLLGQWVVLELSWRTVTWCDVAELRWGGTKERLQQRLDWRRRLCETSTTANGAS